MEIDLLSGLALGLSYEQCALRGGVTINMIPKEGSNQIKSDGVALYSSTRFQTQNVDAAQRAQGVTAPAKIDKTWDYNFSGGFPIKRDKLWWFTSAQF